MKRLPTFMFLALVLIFSLQSWTKADDITDFEIEGMSIGDSALDFFSESEIKNHKQSSQYPNDKFIIRNFYLHKNFETYEMVTVNHKKNDKKYIIDAISAAIYYDELDECLKLKAEIQKEIESLFDANDKQETKFASKQDRSGKSMVYGVQYYTQPYPSSESVVVNCYHMAKDSNIKRALRVSVNTHEYASFIINELYD